MKPNLKFLNDLYSIINIQEKSHHNKIIRIRFNCEHDIFKGHFPGNPILPGVCILQVLKELLATCCGKDLNMVNATTIKFLRPVNPEINNVIDYDVKWEETENNQIFCLTTIRYELAVFCTFKGNFEIV